MTTISNLLQQNFMGYTGSRGFAGSAGFNGSNGSNGFNGSNGSAGFNGSNGFTGSAGIINWITQTSNYTANPFDYILADTSGGTFTISLPQNPVAGTSVIVLDKSNWSINNLNIGRNTKTIENYADDFILDIGQSRVEFTYDGSTWQIYNSIGPRGFTGSSGLQESISYSIVLG